MDLALDVLSWLCLVAGVLFGITAGIGLLRLPDLFTRMHAAGIGDTLAAGLIVLGLDQARADHGLHYLHQPDLDPRAGQGRAARRPETAARPGPRHRPRHRQGRRVIENLIDIALLGFLVAVALAIVRLRNLFAVVMLSGIYSLLSAGIFVQLDAVDVAFTEAAVGAGITTILMLGTLALTTDTERPPVKRQWLPLVLVIVTGAALVYGTLDLPLFGDPNAPANLHVAPRYIEQSGQEVGVPNIVTSVLASYRGYDTLGEVTVIFTAGIGVLALLGAKRRRKRKKDQP
jgi:multicomponent Na+:H+ antiporter subunit B